MSRRRPSFSAYVARRWRAVGLLLVLFAGSLLVLAITDRGHEPLWSARTEAIDRAAVAPDASAVYALIRADENITSIEARRGGSGALLWEGEVRAPRALLASGDGGVVVATDFPYAFLTAYRVDGSVSWQKDIQGNPRALVMEGSRVAIALQRPGNPVLVYDEGRLVKSHSFSTFVKALDLRAGRLAAGTGDGEVALFESDHTLLVNASLPMSVRSLQLSRDGTALLVGGASLTPGDLSGALAFLDATRKVPLLWVAPAEGAVGLVGLDDGGIWALSVEEDPPHHALRLFEAATGRLRWSRQVEGFVARDDSGSAGGAALSPDGRHVVVGTLRGDLQALRVSDGRVRWTFHAEGMSQVAFAQDAPDRLLTNGRLVPGGAYSTTSFLFSLDREPLTDRFPVLALLLGLATAAAVAALVGVGYWRVRRS